MTITSQEQEAPAFFKRGKWYYIFFGDLCCFCNVGSDAKVVASTSPFGPYTMITNLNPRGSQGHIRAQNSDVIEFVDASGQTQYLWSGDMWFSSKSNLKSRDHQYWVLSSQ